MSAAAVAAEPCVKAPPRGGQSAQPQPGPHLHSGPHRHALAGVAAQAQAGAQVHGLQGQFSVIGRTPFLDWWKPPDTPRRGTALERIG